LTDREKQVLGLLGVGTANKLIARQLGLTESTVKVHVRHIMRKLGATNRTQAALCLNSITMTM
jgi:DNA-binding NarL/FixJ family response regulator